MAVMSSTTGTTPNAAKLSLIQMVTQACSEIGLPAPTSVIGNGDQQITQLLALANREARETFQEGTAIGGWQSLRARYRFNLQSTGIINISTSTVGGVTTVTMLQVPVTAPAVGWYVSNGGGSNSGVFLPGTSIITIVNSTQFIVSQPVTTDRTSVPVAFGLPNYPFPTDVDHLTPSTFWDVGQRWQLEGPLSPQDWQALKNGIIATGPRRRYRVMDGQFFIDPVPADNNQLEYEYYSYNWAMSNIGATQSTFLADTDVYLLDDDTMILGLIWRFRRAKGLDYDQEYSTWQNAVDRFKSRQASAGSLLMNRSVYDSPPFIGWANIPDSGYGVS